MIKAEPRNKLKQTPMQEGAIAKAEPRNKQTKTKPMQEGAMI
jgi:hypothetical protein